MMRSPSNYYCCIPRIDNPSIILREGEEDGSGNLMVAAVSCLDLFVDVCFCSLAK